MFYILITVYPICPISFFLDHPNSPLHGCLRTILKLLSCFHLDIWNFVFLLLSYLTMLTYAMKLLGWILFCSLFLIFISHLPTAISFSRCEKDEKLSILVPKVGGGLIVSFNLILISVSSSSSLSSLKELIIDTGLFAWYLLIFGYLYLSVDISRLFRFFFTANFSSQDIFVSSISCVISFKWSSHRSQDLVQ